MASFETRVTEIRADPRGGFSVMLKPHFLERDVAYQKVWLEPHFENHCASIAEDSIAVRTENAHLLPRRSPRFFSVTVNSGGSGRGIVSFNDFTPQLLAHTVAD